MSLKTFLLQVKRAFNYWISGLKEKSYRKLNPLVKLSLTQWIVLQLRLQSWANLVRCWSKKMNSYSNRFMIFCRTQSNSFQLFQICKNKLRIWDTQRWLNQKRNTLVFSVGLAKKPFQVYGTCAWNVKISTCVVIVRTYSDTRNNM